jgi:hypothetical protein
MALPVPKKHLAAADKILNLPDSAIDELVRALESSPIFSRSEEMTAHLASLFKSISIEDLTGIVELIFELYHVREYSGMPKSVFLRELAEGVRKQTEGPAPLDASHIRGRFERFLNIGPLNSISKAIALQRAAERVYCDAQIISDIRPIFGKDVNAPPVAAMLCHTLKIGYHEGGAHKELFLALDEKDLQGLKEVVEREQAKRDSLMGLLNQSKLVMLRG